MAKAVLVSIAASAVFIGLSYVPVPMLDLRRLVGGGVELTFGTISIVPILAAFTVVEIAAVAIPGWRPLRRSPDGRQRLRIVALLLAIGVASGQAFGIVRYL